MRTETKVYTAEVQYWNEVKQEEDIMRVVAFVKTVAELEEMAIKECGESYRGFKGIQVMGDFVPLTK